jgi:predicted dehydrogenase
MTTKFLDTFTAFKRQLVAFVEAVRTSRPPVDFGQTDELMRLIIAGIVSRNEGGRRVNIEEIV